MAGSSPTPTVLVSSSPYYVYGDLEAGDDYLEPNITAAGDAWRAADTDTKGRALVSATRWLNTLPWLGSEVVSGQDLAWPRANTGIAGLGDDEIPDNIIYASFELAALLVEDPETRTTFQDVKVRDMRAGSVSLSFFRGTTDDAVQITSVVPKVALVLITPYLAGAGADGPTPTGVADESPFDDKYDYNYGL